MLALIFFSAPRATNFPQCGNNDRPSHCYTVTSFHCFSTTKLSQNFEKCYQHFGEILSAFIGNHRFTPWHNFNPFKISNVTKLHQKLVLFLTQCHGLTINVFYEGSRSRCDASGAIHWPVNTQSVTREIPQNTKIQKVWRSKLFEKVYFTIGPQQVYHHF